MLKSYCRGFTLIELSIVLVIIGLIIGGVMAGREMIQTAEARKLMTQMESIETAARTFKVKYNCLPGDCAKAASFALGDSGNGNGAVDHYAIGMSANQVPLKDVYNNHVTFAIGDSEPLLGRVYGEIQRFWVHLSVAQLIAGDFASIPNTDTNRTATLHLYFPKDALGRHYLVPATWNGQTYMDGGKIESILIF